MQNVESVNPGSEYRSEFNAPVTCELFGERIAKRVCALVKKELDASGKQSEPCMTCRRYRLQ